MSIKEGPTAGEWNTARDTYGKVRYSRKACVYTSIRGEHGDQLITVAARIENWGDARIMSAAKEMLAALKELVSAPTPTVYALERAQRAIRKAEEDR